MWDLNPSTLLPTFPMSKLRKKHGLEFVEKILQPDVMEIEFQNRDNKVTFSNVLMYCSAYLILAL
jgi:hypothetical protein